MSKKIQVKKIQLSDQIAWWDNFNYELYFRIVEIKSRNN